ncbi:CinA family protein [Serratia sp. AKBS12]|uniref:CinA family protein n=1 Tax=Serratia sp. AKBS12 TaxID=2974597 RepID=UPI002164F081|nr:nicotinamide-nucleotide amidohydrolase family protein [Serratia sp. AKBS12]MCS3409090.1 nicotinamide-nucleotide amidohydrolase family protein [Serratia sp. AKBS12]
MDQQLVAMAKQAGNALKAKGLKLSTAESCTGGWVSMALCAAGDSGDFFTSGFITYTNSAKMRLLRVKPTTLERHTAVSELVVCEMVQGALAASGEQVALAISGYAGPEGGPDGTPAGSVWFAWGGKAIGLSAEKRHFDGDSESVIHQAALFALTRLTQLLQAAG